MPLNDKGNARVIKPSNGQSGYTLLELLVVIISAAVLIGLLIWLKHS